MQRKLSRYWSELAIMFAAVAVMIIAAMSPAAGAAGTAAAGAPLGGRVIVLNPGHGGHERGAVGPAGLEEGVINLKVATYLKAFLEEQGATVFLTREGDYDLDPTSHFSGTRDRLLKDEVAAAKNPDLFLIMHHNANDRDRAKDQIETYYAAGSFGPSKQAAEYILAGLKKWMGLPGLAGPGLFTILAHARGTAVLIEGTYISNPKMEAWLADDENLRKEAWGYREGILAFFAAGVPVLEPVEPVAGQKLVTGRPTLVARVTDASGAGGSVVAGSAGGGAGSAGIVPATVEVRLDQKVIPSRFDALTGVITATPPQPLVNGLHRWVVRAANGRGNYAVPVELDFYVDRQPASLALDAYPTIVPAVAGGAGAAVAAGSGSGATTPTPALTVRIAGRVLDADGAPVLDGTPVYAVVDGGVPARTVALTRDGFFMAEFGPAPGAEIGLVSVSAPPAWKEVVVQFGGENAMVQGRLLADLPHAERLQGAKVRLIKADGSVARETKADWAGHYVLFDIPAGDYTVTASVPGYDAEAAGRVSLGPGATGPGAGLEKTVDVHLQARFGGALFDRKIALNASTGTASKTALAVAGELAVRLNAAGAVPIVVKAAATESGVGSGTAGTGAPGIAAFGGIAGPAEVNATRAAFILSIVSGEKWAVYHYPRDKKTVPAAAELAKRLVEKGLVTSASDVVIGPTREKVVTLANAPSVILVIPESVEPHAAAGALTAWLAWFLR